MQLLADLYWGVSVNSATRRPGRPGGGRQVYNCQSGAPGPRGTGAVGWLSEHEHMVDVSDDRPRRDLYDVVNDSDLGPAIKRRCGGGWQKTRRSRRRSTSERSNVMSFLDGLAAP